MRIADHEFLVNEQGELALLINQISPEPPAEPVFLVCRDEDTAYLYRGENDIHEIVGINPDVIDRVRACDSVLVFELNGDDVALSYDAPADILDESAADADEAEETKPLLTGPDLHGE
jgi:hypothetical protein